MPIHETTLPGGGTGWQWGAHGHVYRSRAGAERQAEAAHAHGYAGDGVAAAAGVILRTPDGDVLFLKRSADGDHPGEWCFPGGSAEPGEDAEETARRELEEETGFRPDGVFHPADRRVGSDLDFSTFVHDVPEKFIPTLNGEHVAFAWAPIGQPPEPLHPGVKATLAADAERDPFDLVGDAWVENNHPRAPNGQFGSNGGGTGAKSSGAQKDEPVSVRERDAPPFVHELMRKHTTGNAMKAYLKTVPREKLEKGVQLLDQHKFIDASSKYVREHLEEELKRRANESAHDEALAFDRASARTYDKDGRLRVAVTNISKAAVNPYFGREIPDWEALGLDPDKTYQLLRHPDEIAKAAATFNNVPLLSRHVPVSADDHQPDLVIGATGTDAEFVAPYLRNSLVVWARDAIEDIESEVKKELSCAYRYRADMTPGTYEGSKYDGVMREIVGNHVALVREGRAGPDVVVGDSAPPSTTERLDMTKPVVLTRKAAVAKGALLAFLRPKLAQDHKIDVTPLLADVTAANFKERKAAIAAGVKDRAKGKLAKDASIDDVAQLLDALEDVEVAEGADIDPNSGLPVVGKGPDEDKAMDAESLAKIKADVCAFLKGKISDADYAKLGEMLDAEQAADEDDEERRKREEEERRAKDEEMKDMVSKSAMDAAITAAVKTATEQATRTQREIRDAERAVRPYVGDLAMAHDSADAVYATALKSLGVKIDGVHPSAFPVLLAAQPLPGSKKPAPVAMDAASDKGFAERFPAAARINVI